MPPMSCWESFLRHSFPFMYDEVEPYVVAGNNDDDEKRPRAWESTGSSGKVKSAPALAVPGAVPGSLTGLPSTGGVSVAGAAAPTSSSSPGLSTASAVGVSSVGIGGVASSGSVASVAVQRYALKYFKVLLNSLTISIIIIIPLGRRPKRTQSAN